MALMATSWGCMDQKRNLDRQPQPEVAAAMNIDALVYEEMSQFDLPGVSLFVMQGDKILVNTGYGLADVEGDRSVKSDTFFQIGSISKCFTAMTVLKLVEEQKLSLETPISQFIPKSPKSWRAIKVGHLLNHTSGLPEYTTLEDYGELDFSDPQDTNWSIIFDKVRTLPLYFQPGERGAYSNTNYHLLAIIVEKLTGKPFNQHLYKFLKNQDIQQVLPLEMAPRKMAVGYRNVEGIYLPAPKVNPNMVTGDAGLVATAPGLAKWLRKLASGSILGPKMLRAMTKAETFPQLGKWDYGLGLDLRSLQGEPKLSHTGSMPGFAAAVAHYPKADLTIAVCANSGDYNYPEQIEIHIARQLLNIAYPNHADVNLSLEETDQFQGVFDAGPLWLQVKLQEGRLVALVRDPRQNRSAIYTYSPLLYQGKGVFVGELAPDSLFFQFNQASETVSFNALGIHWIAKKIPVYIP